MKLAIIGATGAVGEKLISVLNDNGSEAEVTLYATEASQGKQYTVCGRACEVKHIKTLNGLEGYKLAFFCADNAVASAYVPLLAAQGTICIDNSSQYRLTKGVPLIVAQVNADSLKNHKNIIANPNCTTIQTVVALAPLLHQFGLKRVSVCTYQAVSGGGKQALREYIEGTPEGMTTALPHTLKENCIPQIGDFLADGYSQEEHKVMKECAAILRLPQKIFTCTAVRIPVLNAHAVSVNFQLRRAATLREVQQTLKKGAGIIYYQQPNYPMPALVSGSVEVHIGRLRKDETMCNSFNMWVVADNLLKGAAYNAYETAKLLSKEL